MNGLPLSPDRKTDCHFNSGLSKIAVDDCRVGEVAANTGEHWTAITINRSNWTNSGKSDGGVSRKSLPINSYTRILITVTLSLCGLTVTEEVDWHGTECCLFFNTVHCTHTWCKPIYSGTVCSSNSLLVSCRQQSDQSMVSTQRNLHNIVNGIAHNSVWCCFESDNVPELLCWFSDQLDGLPCSRKTLLDWLETSDRRL